MARLTVPSMLLIFFFAMSFHASITLAACPSSCLCRGASNNIVVCSPPSTPDVARVPSGLDMSTTLLALTGSPQGRFSMNLVSRSEMRPLPHLVSLKISFTELSTLDEDALLDLISLSRVDLANNQLTTIQPNTFIGLRNLSVISLSNNPGLMLQDRIFYNLPGLRELYLSGIGITEIRPAVFYGLEKLRKLDLSSNRLTQFSPDVMVSMVNLWSLDLSFNELESLNSLLEPYVRRMKRVQLGGNDWQCNCLVKWLKRYPHVVAPSLTDPVTCAAPPKLKFQHLHDVEDSLLTCEPPKIENCPTGVSVLVGEPIHLRCLVTGDPYPVIIWTFPDGSRLSSGSLPGIPVADRADITVPSADLSYNGKVTISATNAVGFETFDIILDVTEPTTTTTTTTTSSKTTSMPKSSTTGSTPKTSTPNNPSNPNTATSLPHSSTKTASASISTPVGHPSQGAQTPQTSTKNNAQQTTITTSSPGPSSTSPRPGPRGGQTAPVQQAQIASAPSAEGSNIVTIAVAAVCGITALILAVTLGVVLTKKLSRGSSRASSGVSLSRVSPRLFDNRAPDTMPPLPRTPEVLRPPGRPDAPPVPTSLEPPQVPIPSPYGVGVTSKVNGELPDPLAAPDIKKSLF